MEKEYIIEMIKNLNQAINNASQFGDTVTVQSIQNQIQMYENRLKELEEK